MEIERLVTTTTRIAAGLAGALAVAGAVWQLRQDIPVQEMHIPLHTNVLFAPIGILVGAALVLIALSPRRWW
jgi:hypothetical protein